MNYKKRAALLIITIASLCGVAVWGVARLRYHALRTTSDWLQRLPTRDSMVFYVDFAALRKGGVLQMLAGSKVGEEPEYKVFVMKTEFDYTRDLDAVLACFTPHAKYLVVEGRFDWNSLASYAREQGGTCRDALCRMSGSTPERKISFFPLRPNLWVWQSVRTNGPPPICSPPPRGGAGWSCRMRRCGSRSHPPC